jgi:hypothetical protein
MLAQAALAGPAAPYGEYFVRSGESWPDAGPVIALPASAVASTREDNERFQRLLEKLEDEGGPYADTLAEPLADLARFYRRNGDLDQAQRAYHRALHIVRVNEGLYSERQVPILRELFETYRMAGDMATLDARYDYFFRLYGSGQPPYSPVRIDAALEYLRWQREAVRRGLDGQDPRRLLFMYALNERILEGVASTPEPDFADFRDLVLSQLRNLYLLQDRYKPRVETISIAATTRMPGGWEDKDPNEARLETLQRNALTRGRTLLEELINRIPPGQTEALAAAWLELADWNQWNDRPSEAATAYAKVVELLQGGKSANLLEQWLGQSVELPANGAFWQPGAWSGNREPGLVQARYDVSASGRANNIETLAPSSDDESKASRLRRNLAQTRFRPRIVNGVPAAETQLQRTYEVLN